MAAPFGQARALLALVATASLTGACMGPSPPSRATGRLAIDVAPLSLAEVTDADYVVTVTNAAGGGGDVVWTKALSSNRYGDGAGSLSYVGTCDADAPGGVNTVSVDLVALHDAGGLVPAESYENPGRLSREIACVANADVAVTFDLTIVRNATQGFFDVAVDFEDIFCSAKLDCQRGDGTDLELLHNPNTGARDLTAVIGFACTGSPTGSTFLYMDDVIIRCDGYDPPVDVRVDPTGLGNVATTVAPSADPHGYLFGASVFRGVEGFASKAYWNVSLGLDRTKFAAAGACRLIGRATASSVAWTQTVAGFPLPAGSVYPVIDWSVPLTNGIGRVCTRHAVNEPDSGVETRYLGYLPALNAFTWEAGPVYLGSRFTPSTGQVLRAAAAICNPGCQHGGECVSTDVCACPSAWDDGANCVTPQCSAACLNGGTCSAPDTCTCADGFWGATCADACLAGHCTTTDTCDPSTGAPLTCAGCTAGFFGTDCTSTCTPVSACAVTETCTTAGDSVCSDCETGRTQLVAGGACVDDDGCAGDPCAAGVICSDVAAPGTGFTCGSCPAGTFGDGVTCTACAQGDCVGGVSCDAADGTARVCTGCAPGYYGTDCTSTCLAGHCATTDTCDQATGAPLTCTGCAPGFEGTDCSAACTTPGCGPDLADYDCMALLDAGATASGTYWIDPDGAGGDAPFEVYCEQQKYGGGWTLLYNSVGAEGGSTTAFWNIPYAARFTPKGTPDIAANVYAPTLYRHAHQYLDVAEDLTGAEAELLRATAAGIDETTMSLLSPTFVSGSAGVYSGQFAGGWSAPDYDHDAYTTNCATYFADVTQHYSACWSYNLGADADTALDPTYRDNSWGPHAYNAVATAAGLSLEGGTDNNYTRLNRVSRFVKLYQGPGTSAATAGLDCEELLNAGATRSGTYWIKPSAASTARPVYCEQELHGGGWTLLLNSVGAEGGPTHDFWVISYADRFVRKGLPDIRQNVYEPELYIYGSDYLDTVVDHYGADKTPREMFTATAAGIDQATMHMVSPVCGGPQADVCASQFAAGWSSPTVGAVPAADYDTDPTNCAAAYGTTQHYSSCWRYNLGADADADHVDDGWGPHINDTDGPELGLTGSGPFPVAGDVYFRVDRISRFVKLRATRASCLAWRDAGATTTGIYAIDPDGTGAGAPFDAYCDMTTDGGGWTLVASVAQRTTFWNPANYTTTTSARATTLGTPDPAANYVLKLGAWSQLLANRGASSELRLTVRRVDNNQVVALGFLDGLQMNTAGRFTNNPTAARRSDGTAVTPATAACVIQYNSDFVSTIVYQYFDATETPCTGWMGWNGFCGYPSLGHAGDYYQTASHPGSFSHACSLDATYYCSANRTTGPPSGTTGCNYFGKWYWIR